MVHILYLTFDLNDAATWRRVEMLQRGGARVTLAGFHRGEPPERADMRVVPLGRTYNARMGQRARAVARAFAQLGRTLGDVPQPDVILARNLETLALAPRLRAMFGAGRPGLVYECLDIHRMVLGTSAKARTLRAIERALLQRADMILTSSPAFVRHYFTPLLRTRTPIRILENKTLPGLPEPVRATPPTAGEPLCIGWFGVLRCRASLACLDAFTRSAPGKVRVILRGKPALDAIPYFHRVVDGNPDLTFEGPYDGPSDLPKIYGEVHFSWLIDRYEAGQNSEWLLPNRLYEGGAFGAVPITLSGTETADFLARRGLGIAIAGVTPEALSAGLADVTPESWAIQHDAMLAEPRRTWSFTEDDCAALVRELSGITRRGVRVRPAASEKKEALP